MMLLMAVAVMYAQPAGPKPAKAPPPPPRNVVRPGAAGKGPVGRNPAPKAGGGARVGNPGNPVERLMAMPPERREQVLEKLPPQQQANLRARLDRFDKLPAAERARMYQMWNAFNRLPPEKQAIVTRQMQAFNSLPEARREELRPVLQHLRTMPEDRRDGLLNSPGFKQRFSPSEWQMLADISQNYPLPGR
jgi:Protein of unknown function (DUF3106)